MKINRVKLQLKLEKFFKYELWQHIIVIAFVFLCGWLFDKIIQAVMFSVAHIVIRKYFDKQYHCGTTATCMFTTLSIAFFGIMYTLPLALSLLSTIPICFLICWIGYVVQDRIFLTTSDFEVVELDDIVRYYTVILLAVIIGGILYGGIG